MTELKFAWKQKASIHTDMHPSYEERPIHTKAEREMKHYKFLQRLDHIIKVEKQSGSLTNFPTDNKELQKIQHENNPFNDKDREITRVAPEKQNTIEQLIVRGYSLTDIQQLAKASATTVKKVMYDAGLKLRPIFKYCLKSIDKSKPNYYARNIRQVTNYLDISYQQTKKESVLLKKGYHLTKIHKLWYQLPNNVLYSANDLDKAYIKQGINSFENKDLKV